MFGDVTWRNSFLHHPASPIASSSSSSSSNSEALRYFHAVAEAEAAVERAIPVFVILGTATTTTIYYNPYNYYYYTSLHHTSHQVFYICLVFTTQIYLLYVFLWFIRISIPWTCVGSLRDAISRYPQLNICSRPSNRPHPLPYQSNHLMKRYPVVATACANATRVAARNIEEMMGASSDDHSSSSSSLQHVLTTPFEVQWSKSRWYSAVQKKTKEMFIGMCKTTVDIKPYSFLIVVLM